MLEPGTAAPPFTLPDQDGEPVSLEDFEGQRLVLYFFPRADTPGCTAEASSFRDAWEEFQARDVAVVGVSDDPISDLKAFERKHDLPLTLLSDEDGSVARAYDSYGEKEMFGKTFDGVFRNTYLIDSEGRIERAYEGVEPEDHAEELLADVDGP